jgi:hypothetical protein
MFSSAQLENRSSFLATVSSVRVAQGVNTKIAPKHPQKGPKASVDVGEGRYGYLVSEKGGQLAPVNTRGGP